MPIFNCLQYLWYFVILLHCFIPGMLRILNFRSECFASSTYVSSFIFSSVIGVKTCACSEGLSRLRLHISFSPSSSKILLKVRFSELLQHVELYLNLDILSFQSILFTQDIQHAYEYMPCVEKDSNIFYIHIENMLKQTFFFRK